LKILKERQLRKRAEIVIVGAGVVGCSAAYELGRRGVTSIVVLDQGPLDATGGSSFHAPGLVFQTNGSRAICVLAQWTVELYRSLDAPELRTWHPVGSIEVATTEARVAELHRRQGFAASWGLEGEVIPPQAVAERIPLLDPDAILAGFHVPSDGLAKSANACVALRRKAEAAGAEFQGLTPVTGITVRNGRVQGVETPHGDVTASTVLVCAGIWGPELAELSGVAIPMQPMQHLHAWTEPLPELAGTTEEIVHPLLRHQDRSCYYRQRGEGYGIGAYRHEPLAIDPHEFTREDDGHRTAESAFTPEHFADVLDATRNLLPPLAGAKLTGEFNGHFAFTPDGFPLLGESSRVNGLWLAEGIWVTHAGGCGRAVASLLTEGRADGLDLRQLHPDRFHVHAAAPAYVRARGEQQYREIYDILHPLQPLDQYRGLRTTPYHERLEECGGFFVEGAGWERALFFESNATLPPPDHVQRRGPWESRFWSPIVGKEHAATRRDAGLFDLTPFTKLEVEGSGAAAWLNRMCTSEIDRPVGRIVYTTLLNHDGGIVMDLTVTRLAEDRFLVITGGGSGPRDVAWLRANLPEGDGVRMRDVTSSLCVLGLWGPQAREILQPLTPVDLASEAFPYLAAQEIWIGPVRTLALRISYAGELGWELYAPSEQGRWLWDALHDAGRPYGLVPAGTGCFESLRVEKGYRFSGVDIHTEYTPFEAGLGFTVNFSKPSFIGREAALRERERGPGRRLVPILLDDPSEAALGYEPILANGDRVGYVTSANFSYSLGHSIAYGYLPSPLAEEGSRVDVQIFGRRVPGTVATEPLFDPKGERLRA
jgi:glycine cleavage system T protein